MLYEDSSLSILKLNRDKISVHVQCMFEYENEMFKLFYVVKYFIFSKNE